MKVKQVNNILYALDLLTNFSEGEEYYKSVNKYSFDREGFEKRWPKYQAVMNVDVHELKPHEVAEEMGIDLELFETEMHIFIALNPGLVNLQYFNYYFKSALMTNKQVDAICHIKESKKSLTVDYICHRLNVSEDIANRIIKQHNLKVDQKKDPTIKITYSDIIGNESYQNELIKYFNQRPYADLEICIRDLGMNVTVNALRNALETLIERGYKIPCIPYEDPLVTEMEMMKIVKHKEKNLYATPKMIARKFNTTPEKVIAILDAASETYRVEKQKSYELFFKGVLDEINEIGDLCLERFHASPNSSSRWLEIAMMGIEKKSRMLGLNAPTEFKIQQDVQITSKEDRDAIVDAYLATDKMINITPKGKEIGYDG